MNTDTPSTGGILMDVPEYRHCGARTRVSGSCAN